MKQQGETYLGDGLYASFDGFMIVLRAPRTNGDHWVGLEPDVWHALVEYVEAHKTSGVATHERNR